jgi:wyosine [tRNA(Phe)-imidazoG37] synthetase (radical SAM superfamily)
MEASALHIAFGPVPSRRLGQSLGINNVIAKTCSYNCVYCQVGPTTLKSVEPRAFLSPRQVWEAVAIHLEKLGGRGAEVDYLTFVPDGEPSLDLALGETIDALRVFDIPIAVVTNSTLLWREEVRARVGRADLVSIKVDSVDEAEWRRINRPHPELRLGTILQGIREFAAGYSGTLITETMLLGGINDGGDGLSALADFLSDVAPRTAYLAVPVRPTNVAGIRGPDESALIRAHALFAARLAEVELLTGQETGGFAHTGNAREDLLAIAAVHPMREAAVRRLLAEDDADWTLVEELISSGDLKAVDHEGERFYLRPVGSC